MQLSLGSTPTPPPIQPPAPSTPDTSAPTIKTSGIQISKNADATFTVIIPLQDTTAVLSGKITRNGAQLYEFKNGVSIADFQIDVLGPIVITAQDPAGNKLNQTIDLTTYYTP